MKHLLVCALAGALVLSLAACGAPPEADPVGSAPGASEIPEGAVMTCRLVGEGLLAEGEDGPYGGTGIFTFGTDEDTVVTVDGQPAQVSDLCPGMLLTVTWNGMVAESYPAQLGMVDALAADSGDTDDRCGLYLQVLEDLWADNGALTADISCLGLDLSEVRDLTPSEKDAVSYLFSCRHPEGELVTGTWEELVEAGYIDGEELYWEDGVFLSLRGSAEDTFTGEIWRSGLGASYLVDCTAQMAGDGSWTYEVGSHATA